MENKTSFHKFMDATNVVKMEFALIDEVKTKISEAKIQISNLKQREKALEDLFDSAAKLATQLEDEFRVGTSLSNVITKAVDRTNVAAKELGVDAKNLVEVKEVLGLQQELERALLKVEQTIKAYRSL